MALPLLSNWCEARTHKGNRALVFGLPYATFQESVVEVWDADCTPADVASCALFEFSDNLLELTIHGVPKRGADGEPRLVYSEWIITSGEEIQWNEIRNDCREFGIPLLTVDHILWVLTGIWTQNQPLFDEQEPGSAHGWVETSGVYKN